MSVVRRALVEGDGGVRRATLEVVLDGAPGGDAQLVSLALRDGRVTTVCSCGEPACAHTAIALRWLDDGDRDAGRTSLLPGGTVLPSSPAQATEPGLRAPASTTDPGRSFAPLQRSQALAAAIDDLITSIVRAGVGAAAGTPSLDESLRRLVAAAPAPMPTSIGRVVGRLREALVGHDVEVVTRLCAGLGRFADALRDGDATVMQAWLGIAGAAVLEGRNAASIAPSDAPQAGDLRLFAARLVELGREWVTTVDRAGLERRYLADPRSGALYREERMRGAPAPSLGPCPRTLDVALAELEPGPAPRRVRLLQYEVALAPEPGVYTELATHAERLFGPLLALFREQVASFPALAEPCALVVPSAIERTSSGADLVDAEGGRLALASEPAAGTAALLGFAANGVPSLVIGRLVTREGALALTPLSVVVGPGDAPALRRLA